MPGTYSYPGVYIEEIPSGVRTISGVSTSDTAFVDFFKRGPVNEPVRITNFGDFERVFGGVDARSESSFAIRQYYLNGGSIAWVVRVIAGVGYDAPSAAAVTLDDAVGDTLTVAAASPGVWGNSLRVGVEHVPGSTLFNLLVREVVTANNRDTVVDTETYLNLSMDANSARYAVAVVNGASALVRLTRESALTDTDRPSETTGTGSPPSSFVALTGGDDGVDPSATTWRSADGMTAITGTEVGKTGIYALDKIAPNIFSILCLPGTDRLEDADAVSVIAEASAYCDRKRAFFIVDIPPSVVTRANMVSWMGTNDSLRDKNSAVYFPRLEMADPTNEGRPRNVAPSGTLAGIYARTDASRGVWKAPAGTDATLRGARLATQITDLENGELNPLGINALRSFPIFGTISWGSRTLDGADQKASEWKYIPVRRTALYIEESLYQGLKWVVFEPNDDPLWSQIRLNVGAFMQNLFRQGAFQGKTPAEAYFVKCDKETTTQNDVDRGIVNVLVGFAPLKPAEFVVIKIQQKAGQLQT
jgi:phage tail sheath protein FI